jgi:hypothetical protein
MSIATAESHTTPHHRGVPKIVFLPRSRPRPGFSVFGRADTNNLLLPNLCAMEALTHIQETAPKLNPINLGKPHDNLSLTRRRKARNEEERLEEGEILFDPTITCKNSLAECFRIFTDSPEVHPISASRAYAVRFRLRHQKVTVYTDGACYNNRREDAQCGSRVWFGPDDWRNTALKVPGQQHSNQIGELMAVIVAANSIPSFWPLHTSVKREVFRTI